MPDLRDSFDALRYDLDAAQAPDMLADAFGRVPSMGGPDGPSPWRRAGIIALALVIAIASTVFVVNTFDRDGSGPAAKTGSSSPSGLTSYTDPTGWTIDYPSDWTVTPISQTADGLGAGTSISNTDQPEATDAVGLTLTHAIDVTPDTTMSSTPLPLSVDHFGVSPGPSNESSLEFRLGGIRYLAILKVGPAADPADIAAVRRMIASIRPVGMAPVNPSQIGPLGQPCSVSGDRTSLDAAAAGTGYQLLAPHDPIADTASPDSLIGVWRCAGDGVEMAFASGITVVQEANTITDPATAWQRLAREDSADTSVGTVQGQPAALIDPAKSTGNALGSVTVVIDGTIVWVIGDGHIPISDLMRVAESLQPS